MYSIAKFHYTTIIMNKEGAACFVQKKINNKNFHSICFLQGYTMC